MGADPKMGTNDPKMGTSNDPAYEPQSPMDQHGPGYENDVPMDWRRGGGKNQAEDKPGYVRTGKNPPNRG